MYKATILPLAKDDIRSAANWYEKKKTGLGKRFTGEVRKKVAFIRKNPSACMIKYDNVRTAVLNIFPFMLHYIVEENNRTIVITSVFHTSRNPENLGKWINK